MNIKELEQFIEEEIKKLVNYYKNKSDEELTLAMTAKMNNPALKGEVSNN